VVQEIKRRQRVLFPPPDGDEITINSGNVETGLFNILYLFPQGLQLRLEGDDLPGNVGVIRL
jgi:hypothetical protein